MTDVGSISRAIALAATEAARDKQATDVVVLDVAELLAITDYFVICSASSDRQIKTVIQAVAVILYLLPLPGWAHLVAMIVMGLAWLITIVTGLDYIREAVKLRRTAHVGR